MKIIQSGHDVLSLFGISAKTQALTKRIPNLNLVKSLVGAFFIVLLAGLLLGLAQKALTGSAGNSISVTADYQESVAFIPGQFVSGQINQGYISQ